MWPCFGSFFRNQAAIPPPLTQQHRDIVIWPVRQSVVTWPWLLFSCASKAAYSLWVSMVGSLVVWSERHNRLVIIYITWIILCHRFLLVMVIIKLKKKSGAKLSLTRSFCSRHPNFCHQREMVNSCEKVREVNISSSHQTGVEEIVPMWSKQPCHFEGTMQWNAVHSLMRGKITRQRNLSEM